MSDKELNREARKVREENPLNLASSPALRAGASVALSLAPPARAGVAVHFASDLDEQLDLENALPSQARLWYCQYSATRTLRGYAKDGAVS